MPHNIRKNIIALLLVGLILISFILSLASLLTVRPSKSVELWVNTPNSYDEILASSFIKRLNLSILINPFDANSHLILAQICEKQEQQNANSDTCSTETHYLRAVSLQPTWDYARVLLAHYYSKKNSDLLAVVHLKSALELGGFELKTQQIAIPLIMKYWPEFSLNGELSSKPKAVIAHALKYHDNALLTLESAKAYRRFSELKPFLVQRWHKDRLKQFQKETEERPL